MSTLPYSVVIEDDPDVILEWSVQSRELLYDLGVEAAQCFLDNQQLHKQTIVEFVLEQGDTPYADVILHRVQASKSLDEAINYYVQEELYEKAIIAKRIQKELELSVEKTRKKKKKDE